MPSSTLRRGSFDSGVRLAALWAGMLAGPVAWAALLETNYVLSYVACEQRHTWMLHLATAVALALIAGAALAAWRAAPPLRDDPKTERPSTEPAETGLIRARFMAIGGLTLCAWFAIVILATEIPTLVIKPCTP
jgi:hypothetical protein